MKTNENIKFSDLIFKTNFFLYYNKVLDSHFYIAKVKIPKKTELQFIYIRYRMIGMENIINIGIASPTTNESPVRPLKKIKVDDLIKFTEIQNYVIGDLSLSNKIEIIKSSPLDNLLFHYLI